MSAESVRETPRDRFLRALALGSTVSNAAATAGISRRRVYELREDDAEFAAAWASAIEEGTDLLEDEATRRAYRGVDTPCIYRGKIGDTYRTYSDTLLIFLLKARRPEKYRERFTQELTGPNGQPLPSSSFNLVLNVAPALPVDHSPRTAHS